MSKAPVTQGTAKQDPETTGHSWDGIEEFNNPLPRWWLWTFYLTIIWGVLYTIAYPAWPLIHGATTGVLGFATRTQVEKEIAAVDKQNAAITAELASADLTTLQSGTPLYTFARNAGAAVFKANCIQCHGVEGQGAKGYPTLSDNDWLWGGKIDEVLFTVTHGIRNNTDPDARYSQMPAFGADGTLTPEQIGDVVEYVREISGQEHDAEKAKLGNEIFHANDTCSQCHGPEGKGNRDVGAPNLTDAIWLYGGDRASLTHTITYARFGVMPAWGQRLSEADVKAAAVYVHSLGGGE